MKRLHQLSKLAQKIMTPANSEFLIGHFRVQPARNMIFFSNQEVKITPLLMSILTLLAEHHGKTVSKEQLLDEVWGNVSVSEAALFRNISELRRVFGDDAKTQNFIETIPKKGYRLKAEVIFLDNNTPQKSRQHRYSNIFLVACILLSIVFLISTFFSDKRPDYKAPNIEYLTSNKANQRRPRISQSGRFLLYFNNAQGKRSLVLNDRTSNTNTILIADSQGIGTATFSPSEQDIIYVINQKNKCELRQLSLITKLDKKLVTCQSSLTNLVAVDWSSDERYILYGNQAQRTGYLDFLIIDSKTLASIQVNSPSQSSMYYPRFSPDGKKIVYVSTPYAAGLTHEIGIFDIVTQKSETIYSSNDFILQVEWAQNNEDIYFLVGAGKNNSKGIWQINRKTRETHHMLNGDFIDMDYNRAMNQFVLSKINSQRNVWHYSRTNKPSENQLSKITESNLIDREATLSSDGKTLAFVSNRSGNNEIWLKNLQDNTLKQITRYNNSSLSVPRWLPSGQKISFSLTTNRRKEFFIFDLNSEKIEKVKLPTNVDAIDWASDETIFWTSIIASKNQSLLSKTNLASGETIKVGSIPTSAFRYHPDLGIIYSPYTNSKSLWIYSLKSHKHQQLKEITLLSPTAWDFYKNELFFLSQFQNPLTDQSNAGIYSLNLNTLDKKHLINVKVPRIQDFGRRMLSANKQSIFYTGLENVTIDLISVSYQ